MHHVLSHFCYLKGLLGKKAREAIHRLYQQIPVFTKIDCGAHIKSPFLWFLLVLVHGGACTLSECNYGAQEGKPGT